MLSGLKYSSHDDNDISSSSSYLTTAEEEEEPAREVLIQADESLHGLIQLLKKNSTKSWTFFLME
jgi:hypothetical protein